MYSRCEPSMPFFMSPTLTPPGTSCGPELLPEDKQLNHPRLMPPMRKAAVSSGALRGSDHRSAPVDYFISSNTGTFIACAIFEICHRSADPDFLVHTFSACMFPRSGVCTYRRRVCLDLGLLKDMSCSQRATLGFIFLR